MRAMGECLEDLEAGSDPRATLAFFGAPLALHGRRDMPLEAAIARSLQLLGSEPRIFLCLPIVLMENRQRLDFAALRRLARAGEVQAELGMVLDLTSRVSGDRSFGRRSVGLPRRVGRPRYLVPVDGFFIRKLASQGSPEVAKKWGFRFGTSVEDFREFYVKHHG